MNTANVETFLENLLMEFGLEDEVDEENLGKKAEEA